MGSEMCIRDSNDLMDFGQSIRNESLIAHARALKHLSFQRQETTLIAEIFHNRKINQDASEIYDDLQRLREEIKVFERGEAERNCGVISIYVQRMVSLMTLK